MDPSYPNAPEFHPLDRLIGTIVVAMVFYLIGRIVYYFNAKKSRADRIRGQYIPHCMAVGSVIGGIYGIVTYIDAPGPDYSPMYNSFGMLIGLVIGFALGTWRMLQPEPAQAKAVPAKQELTIAGGEPIVHSDNPYSPPTQL